MKFAMYRSVDEQLSKLSAKYTAPKRKESLRTFYLFLSVRMHGSRGMLFQNISGSALVYSKRKN